MAYVKVEIPPKPSKSIVIGEIDVDEMRIKGTPVRISGPRGSTWFAHAVAHADGSLVFVPAIPPDRL